MNLVIIEDEKRAARRIEALLKEINPDLNVLSILHSVQEANAWFDKNTLPDLIISDIQLGDGRAFDILESISELPPVIFTTAYDEYAIKAFKSNGIDYLLKPIDKAELARSIDKFLKLKKADNPIDIQQLAAILNTERKVFKSRFMIKVGEKLKSVPSDEIACFYSLNGGTYIHTIEKRNYTIDYSMDQLDELMDERSFFRINRKLMISFNSIEAIHTWSGSRLRIELSCAISELEDDMLVSRERVKEFKEWLDR